MSSSCSSIDLGIDPDFDETLPDALLNDIEQFADHVNNLRNALSPNAYIPDGENRCVHVHAALSLVSTSVRDLLVKYSIFRTSQILMPASQLVHSIKEIDFDNALADSARTLQCIEKLEAAVGSTLRMSVSGRSSQSPAPVGLRAPNTGTLGRRLNKQSSVFPSSSTSANGQFRSSSNIPKQNGNGVQLRQNVRLQRRHSANQPRSAADSDSHVMRELLVRQEGGLEMAFERCKAWSKYSSQLLNFVRNRLALEHEHARNVAKLAEQTKNLLFVDPNNNRLPLARVFDDLMDSHIELSSRTDHLVNLLNQRFVATLENRQKEHDSKRRKLKTEWLKQKKQLDQCEDELRRAIQNLNMKEGGYLKARDHTIRHVQSVPNRTAAVDISRQRKEIEKRRRNEETALNRKTEAENEVWRLERELDERRRAVQELRILTIGELCDLIRHCDLTTTASASHYVKSFSELWAPLPQQYNRLAHAIRENSPGSEYMSFLQSLPGRSISSASLLRGSNSTADKAEDDFANSSLSMATSSSESGPSTARRRNALNVDEHTDYIAETSHRRQKKTMARIFDQILTSPEYSDAARSHELVRTRQVTRCAHCEHLVIFDAVKCTICGIVWHKKCLTLVTVMCGPSAHRLTVESASKRRMSIFGVPLKGHLEAQHRRVPLILERCIDELQRRGMTSKGIYRTCGVKSKIEQICAQFEQANPQDNTDISDVNPINLASVVKLYLRKLPEPLMTYELYREWVDFDANDTDHLINDLRELCRRLPQQNHDTLRFLLLHLKRVTWFELENLMTAANLAAVISPSLVWPRSSNTDPSTPASFSSATSSVGCGIISDAHQQTKVVELLIQHVYEIFKEDKAADWKNFFETYPEVEEPNPADPDTEASLSTQIKDAFDGEEDELEEDYDLDDEPVSLSGLSMQQEPQLPNSSAAKIPESATSSNGRRARLEPTTPERYRLGKQRSFTTSILVSPQSDRKLILGQKQHSVEENQPQDMPSHSRTLKSGDVVVEIKKVCAQRRYHRPVQNQYCAPEHAQRFDRSEQRFTGKSKLERRMGGGSALTIASIAIPHADDDDGGQNPAEDSNFRSCGTTVRKPSNQKTDGERLRLQNVGVIFTGKDVSYV